MNYLGIDCGATNLRMGLVDEDGNLTDSKKVPSPLKSNPQSLSDIVKSELGDKEFTAIGIGVPGPLDLEKGLVLPSANLGNKEPLSIRTQLEETFKKKVSFDRDAIVALIGEAWVGAAKECKNVVLLTLGTGVGGAILIDGEIDRGEDGKAGEIGHMIIDSESDKQCGLGHRGCLEAMINSTDDLGEVSRCLGIGLANIASIFNPEKIIIGGGKVTHLRHPEQGDSRVEGSNDFLPKALEIMRENGMESAATEIEVEYAKLDEWGGVIGAAKLAIEKNDHN